MVWIINIAIIIALYLGYLKFVERKKYTDSNYLRFLKDAEQFLKLINDLNEYITWVQRHQIQIKYEDTGRFFKNKSRYYKKAESVDRFNNIFQNFEDFVVNFNIKYVQTQKEEHQQFFDNIENKKLDEQQRTAVVTDEYSNLIVAGAGSGKTLTILAKVKYLVEKKMIAPEDILVLSFTQKTVEELNERLKDIHPNVCAQTFHKLGYDQIKNNLSLAPVVTNENTLSNTIKEYLIEEIFSDSKALNAFVQYVACYMNIPEEYDKYDSLGEKIDTEKGIDLRTLKSKYEPLNIVRKEKLDTFQGEKVKSVEELNIANFLFLNGINYEYEKRYPVDGFIYQPDFYLKDYDIYLEHFGIDENNRATWLNEFNERAYIDEMEKKRQTHLENGTKLLETYSYYNKNNVLIDKLKEILEAEGVKFSPRDSREILNRVTNNNQNFGKEINKLIETFIKLSKSRKLGEDDLNDLYSSQTIFKIQFMKERYKLFLQFSIPILKKYNEILKESNQIDFDDMINQATDLITKNKANFSFKYIIIDEYQDISFSRLKLIQQIRDLSGARLTCVGDDWQSIYRFAGSDISLFSNFEKHVGKFELLLIEQTYRNSQSLINISANFIKKNKKQISKNPISQISDNFEPLKFIGFTSENLEQKFINEVEYLVNKYGNESILVLGRHTFDIKNLIIQNGNSRIKYIERSGKLEVDGFEKVDIKFLTVHRSKGTEAKNVIILNLNNNLMGFPNKMTDDPILSVLLSDHEEYRFAEERRLFYVALTRTKKEVLLFLPSDTSIFAEELLNDNDYLLTNVQGRPKATLCPYCKTGRLVVRKNSRNGNNFLGCSHYPACNQTYNDINILNDKLICTRCRSGFMVKRSGGFGDFLGCTNYQKCTYKINLSE